MFFVACRRLQFPCHWRTEIPCWKTCAAAELISTIAHYLPGLALKSILDNWTELTQPCPTHIVANSQSASRLDRGATSAPVNQLLNISITVATIETPEAYERWGLSDHCPLSYCFMPRSVISSGPRPISKHICKDPASLATLQLLLMM